MSRRQCPNRQPSPTTLLNRFGRLPSWLRWNSVIEAPSGGALRRLPPCHERHRSPEQVLIGDVYPSSTLSALESGPSGLPPDVTPDEGETTFYRFEGQMFCGPCLATSLAPVAYGVASQRRFIAAHVERAARPSAQGDGSPHDERIWEIIAWTIVEGMLAFPAKRTVRPKSSAKPSLELRWPCLQRKPSGSARQQCSAFSATERPREQSPNEAVPLSKARPSCLSLVDRQLMSQNENLDQQVRTGRDH